MPIFRALIPEPRRAPPRRRPSPCARGPTPRGTPCRRTVAPCRRARCADLLHLRPAGTDQDRALVVAVDENRGADRADVALVPELVDRDRRLVRHLLAEQPEDLLADELRREEALVAVGDLVGTVEGGDSGSSARTSETRRSSASPFAALTGTIAANGRSSASAAICGSSSSLTASASTLFSAATAPTASGADRSPRDRPQRCAPPRGRARPRRPPRGSASPRGSSAR